MTRQVLLTIERMKELGKRINLSRSNIYNKIQEGLWCPPINLGDRAVGYLKHESDELLVAYVNGYSKKEIKGLVKRLVAERKNLLGGDYNG